MARLILNSYPAAMNGQFLQIAITQDGPLPRRIVEIGKATDAAAALQAYKLEAQATGKPAVVSMMIARGDRKPPGFDKLNSQPHHSVNL